MPKYLNAKTQDQEKVANNTPSKTDQQITLQRHYSSFQYSSSGVIAGICTAFVNQPLDTVKSRLQVQGMKCQVSSGHCYTNAVLPELRSYNGGTFQTLQSIYKEEGFRSLYKGLPPSMLSIPLSMGVFFPIYHKCKIYYSEWLNKSVMNPLVICPSVISSWLTSSLFVSPISLVKVRLQTQPFEHGMLRMFRNIIQKDGFMSLYQGYKGHLFGSIFFSIFFSIYDPLKHFLSHRTGFPIVVVSPFANLASMSIACLINYPNDLILSRMQYQRPSNRQYSGYLDAVRKIITCEGWFGLYTGLPTYLLRIAISSIVSMSVFELCLHQWEAYIISSSTERSETNIATEHPPSTPQKSKKATHDPITCTRSPIFGQKSSEQSKISNHNTKS